MYACVVSKVSPPEQSWLSDSRPGDGTMAPQSIAWAFRFYVFTQALIHRVCPLMGELMIKPMGVE